MVAYFPEGQVRFSDIRANFLEDVAGVEVNAADGLVFVTNQHLTKSQRRVLMPATDQIIELFHLERVITVFDQPTIRQVRQQFYLEQDPIDDLLGHTTGGDTFAYGMHYDCDLTRSCARNFVVIRNGRFPPYDLRFDIPAPPSSRRAAVTLWLNGPCCVTTG